MKHAKAGMHKMTDGKMMKNSAKGNPFGKPEAKKNEAAEMKMAGGNKKVYAKMEAKYEPGMHKGKK